MSQQQLERYARAMYARTNALWAQRGPEVFGGDCGFSILSGPPLVEPPVMVSGANPGFGDDDHEPHLATGWPERSHVDDASWMLARKLRTIFDGPILRPMLSGAMQCNFNFFASSSIARESRYRWDDLPPALRADLESHSAAELRGYVAESRPVMILVLGIDTFDRHVGAGEIKLKDGSGRRRLMVAGRFAETPTFGILHPSGARVARADWQRVSEALERAVADATDA
jgi:hypothetical protein